MLHTEVQGDRRDDRCGEREVNFKEDGYVVCAVDEGGFFKRFRQRLEVAAHEDHVPQVDECRDDVHEEVVLETEIEDQEVGRHEAAAEVHRDKTQHCVNFFAYEVRSGNCERQHTGNEHAADRTDDGTCDGDEVRHPDLLVCENQLVVSPRKLTRVDGQTTKGGIVGIVQGNRKGIQERVQRKDKNQNDGDDHDDIDHVVAGHALGADFVWIFCHLSVPPLEKLCFAEFTCYVVGTKEQCEVDDGLKETGRCCEGETTLADTQTINEGIEHVCVFFQYNPNAIGMQKVKIEHAQGFVMINPDKPLEFVEALREIDPNLSVEGFEQIKTN